MARYSSSALTPSLWHLDRRPCVRRRRGGSCPWRLNERRMSMAGSTRHNYPAYRGAWAEVVRARVMRIEGELHSLPAVVHTSCGTTGAVVAETIEDHLALALNATSRPERPRFISWWRG